MALTQHYFTNGTGRDTYISVDNGGFRPGLGELRPSASTNDLWNQFRRCPPARLRLPGISLESRKFMASRQRQSCKRLATPKMSSGNVSSPLFPGFSEFDPPKAAVRSQSFTLSPKKGYNGPVFSKQTSKKLASSAKWSSKKSKRKAMKSSQVIAKAPEPLKAAS